MRPLTYIILHHSGTDATLGAGDPEGAALWAAIKRNHQRHWAASVKGTSAITIWQWGRRASFSRGSRLRWLHSTVATPDSMQSASRSAFWVTSRWRACQQRNMQLRFRYCAHSSRSMKSRFRMSSFTAKSPTRRQASLDSPHVQGDGFPLWQCGLPCNAPEAARRVPSWHDRYLPNPRTW